MHGGTTGDCILRIGSRELVITREELREWAGTGRIRADDEIWQPEPNGEWVRARYLPELKSCFPTQRHSLITEVRQLSPTRWFTRTRRAVLAGRPLFDYPLAKLQAEGLLSALAFNVRESLLALLLASPLLVVIGAVIPLYSLELDTGPDTEVLEFLINLGFSATAPFVFLLVAYIAAWGSLRAEDLSSDRIRRAVRAFLYLDGAQGLVPQALLILGVFTLLSVLPSDESPLFPDVLLSTGGLVGSALILVGLLWSLLLLAGPVRAKLFAINGYSPHSAARRDVAKTTKPGPVLKYTFARIAGVLLLGIYLLSVIATTLLLDDWIASFVSGEETSADQVERTE
jgi:hypothetical protein